MQEPLNPFSPEGLHQILTMPMNGHAEILHRIFKVLPPEIRADLELGRPTTGLHPILDQCMREFVKTPDFMPLKIRQEHLENMKMAAESAEGTARLQDFHKPVVVRATPLIPGESYQTAPSPVLIMVGEPHKNLMAKVETIIRLTFRIGSGEFDVVSEIRSGLFEELAKFQLAARTVVFAITRKLLSNPIAAVFLFETALRCETVGADVRFVPHEKDGQHGGWGLHGIEKPIESSVEWTGYLQPRDSRCFLRALAGIEENKIASEALLRKLSRKWGVAPATVLGEFKAVQRDLRNRGVKRLSGFSCSALLLSDSRQSQAHRFLEGLKNGELRLAGVGQDTSDFEAEGWLESDQVAIRASALPAILSRLGLRIIPGDLYAALRAIGMLLPGEGNRSTSVKSVRKVSTRVLRLKLPSGRKVTEVQPNG